MAHLTESGSLVSLPWYDLPELRADTDTLWRHWQQQFRLAGLSDVPPDLNRNVAYERQWTSPNFLFGQACGYDVRMAFAEHLQVVATPCYDVPGCQGSNYRSFVVVPQDSPYHAVEQLRGTRCVINTPTSHSGMNVLRALVAPLHTEGRFFASVTMSGAHETSLQMMQQGKVDVAAIDCVTYALLERYRPQELSNTRVIHETGLVPAPPYVTAVHASPEMVQLMRHALLQGLEQAALKTTKARLMLGGVQILPDDAYVPIESLEDLANEHRYFEISCGSISRVASSHDSGYQK